MSTIDPQLNQIPGELQKSHELRIYFEELERFRHDIWVRTGGGDDAIANAALEEKYPWPTSQLASETAEFSYPTLPTDKEASFNYPSLPSVSQSFRALTVITDYTALGFDFINAKSNAVITFPREPSENDVIIIRNGDGSKIRLEGNNRNINGSSSGVLHREGTAITFQYFITDDEWFAR